MAPIAPGNVYFLDKHDGVIRRIVTTAPVTPPMVSLSPRVTTISRSAGQKTKIFVTRVGDDLSASVAVSLRLKGGEINGQDYALIADTVVIPAGQTRAKIKVVPLAGGADGKIKFVLLPASSYLVNPAAKKVNIEIVE